MVADAVPQEDSRGNISSVIQLEVPQESPSGAPATDADEASAAMQASEQHRLLDTPESSWNRSMQIIAGIAVVGAIVAVVAATTTVYSGSSGDSMPSITPVRVSLTDTRRGATSSLTMKALHGASPPSEVLNNECHQDERRGSFCTQTNSLFA